MNHIQSIEDQSREMRMACERGQIERVKELLDNGADIEDKDN